MRGVKFFAYDLNVSDGGVSSRVALLLRSTEPKPSCPRFDWKISPSGGCLGSLQKGCWNSVARGLHRVSKVVYSEIMVLGCPEMICQRISSPRQKQRTGSKPARWSPANETTVFLAENQAFSRACYGDSCSTENYLQGLIDWLIDLVVGYLARRL